MGRGDKDTFSFSSDCHPLSQLFGFVFACYVSKVFLEEEDSCKCIPPPPHSRPRDVGAAGLCQPLPPVNLGLVWGPVSKERREVEMDRVCVITLG